MFGWVAHCLEAAIASSSVNTGTCAQRATRSSVVVKGLVGVVAAVVEPSATSGILSKPHEAGPGVTVIEITAPQKQLSDTQCGRRRGDGWIHDAARFGPRFAAIELVA